MSETTVEFDGVLDRDAFKPSALEARDRLAEAGKRGAWNEVLALLDDEALRLSPNSWRPGGSSWFTPLHQAAWHGARPDVVDQLVARGAWLSLTTSAGETASDVARRRGHVDLAAHLQVTASTGLTQAQVNALDWHLRALVDSRIRPQLVVRMRYPTADLISEAGGRLWFPVPGMYGGFSIVLRDEHLEVESWIRVVGGSEQTHMVGEDGVAAVMRSPDGDRSTARELRRCGSCGGDPSNLATGGVGSNAPGRLLFYCVGCLAQRLGSVEVVLPLDLVSRHWNEYFEVLYATGATRTSPDAAADVLSIPHGSWFTAAQRAIGNGSV